MGVNAKGLIFSCIFNALIYLKIHFTIKMLNFSCELYVMYLQLYYVIINLC